MSRTRIKPADRFLAALLSVMMFVAMMPIGTLNTLADTTYPDEYTVSVKDSEGNVISGATVEYTITYSNNTGNPQQGSGTTDENGVVSLGALVAPGAGVTADIKIRVTADGYTECSNTYTSVSTPNENIDVQLTAEVVSQSTLSVSVTGNATVKLNDLEQNNITVDNGNTVKVEITPETGSFIKTLTVADEPVDVENGQAYMGSLTIDKDTVISATVVKLCTVTSNAGEGGTITLNSSSDSTLQVEENSSVDISVKPDTGYLISAVSIGGVAQTVTDETSFDKSIPISDDTEVVATFVKAYTVTVTYDGNGNVTTSPEVVAGSVTVKDGETISITATPNSNYRVSKVLVNDIEDENVKGENDEVYSTELTADKDYTVSITFAPNQFKVYSNTVENGSVEIGAPVVDYDSSTTVTLTPAEGYDLDSVTVNGTAITIFDEITDEYVKFTLANITEDQEVEATFVILSTAPIDYVTYDVSSAVRKIDDRTYVFKNDAAIDFSTEKDSIRINGETTDSRSMTIDETTTIEKIELSYRILFFTRWHEVEDITKTNPITIVIDKTQTSTTITPEALMSGSYYNDDFNVTVSTEDPDEYSGIASVEYFVTDENLTGDYDSIEDANKTQSGTLYTYTSTIDASWSGDITVDVSEDKNNSDYVAVWVKVTDRAGNVETIKSDNLLVNATAPEITSVSIDGTLADGATASYYNSKRTAIVEIVDRAGSFNETSATNGIKITAKTADGKDVPINKGSMITWSHNGDVHTASIVFSSDANYTWEISYTNKAGLEAVKTNTVETGDSIYSFSVDTDAPTAEVSIDSDNKWNKLLSVITFGLWKNTDVTVDTIADDEISPTYDAVYYKASGDEAEVALTAAELDTLYANGEFVSEVTVSTDEKFVVYARVTDFAGNTVYVGTNGVIVDKTNGIIELTADEPNSYGFYNSDVDVDISVNEAITGKDAYSGIKTIDYKVLDGTVTTQSGNLYTFSATDPKYSDLLSEWTGNVTVDSKKNNSDNVKVIVTVEDNSGNTYSKEITLAINVDKLEAEIKFVDSANKVDGNRGYFGTESRVATITLTDRSSSFDATAATNGISVKALNAAGDVVDNSYTVSDWISEGNEHTATITFDKNANYEWSLSYTNKAGNELDVDNSLSVGKSVTPFVFTVDTTAPTGEIRINENVWDKLLNVLTFGLYSKVKAEVTASVEDIISPTIVEYYKTSKTTILSEDELDKLYKYGNFKDYSDFTVDSDEQFTVYLRMSDYAGNYAYINSDGYKVDTEDSTINLTPETANKNGAYGLDYADGIEIDVSVTDAAPYSGVKSIDYTVVKDNDIENPTQSGNLFAFDIVNPTHDDLVDEWNGCIVVDPELNNSSNVAVYVTVVDNAGNESTECVDLDIDITAPVIEVSFDNNDDNNTYFDAQRTATVVISERTEHFDADVATESIEIVATDANAKVLENTYTISDWTTVEGDTPDAATHTATIAFEADAKYQWAISYKDDADNSNETVYVNDSVSPFDFTVDTTAPTGIVTAKSSEGREVSWDSLRDSLTFGFWSREEIAVSVTCDDETSMPIASVEYYKVVSTNGDDGTQVLTVEDLDAITDWTAFDELTIDTDEQFVVYLKITDLAGNYSYISTNGLIVDHTAPLEETIAPEITIDPVQPINGLYNGDVDVAIKVTDPLTGGTYSGLKTITYKVLNMGEETQSGTLYEFDNSDPKQSELFQTWEGDITVNSKLNNSNDVVIEIYAEDNSLNSSDDSTAIKIDITKPTIDIVYDNNAAESGTLFKTNRTAEIVITERNFNPKDVLIDITNTDGVIPNISKWKKTNGTENEDDTKWTATIEYVADGDYTFDISYSDLADNAADKAVYAESTVAATKFTIDKTLPMVNVSYDNNVAQNGNYYNNVRTATIVITEHNFDTSRVNIDLSATDDGEASTLPTVSKWKSNGDKHTATIYYGKDSKYTFDISVKDSAGNSSADYAIDTFFIDMTAPTLEITGVADKSANRGDVVPVVTYSDTNYDAENVTITLAGANRGNVELEGSYTEIHNGRTFTFNNFVEKSEIDDIYILNATLTDKAGNETTQTITFSVNRFGSTYIFSDSTENLNATYVQKSKDVVVTEVNANELSNIQITLFKNNETLVLERDIDYKIDVTGGNGKWYNYKYTIFAKNFEDDGVYRVSFHSEDAAGNVAENTLDTKGAEVGFGIDKTTPNIVVTNLESGVTYALENMTVKMSASDNLVLSSVTVYLDDYDKPYKTWTAEEIAEIIAENGEFTFDVSGDSNKAHKVKIVCVDAAGNEQVEEITDFFVTTNLWVRFFNNKSLFFGTIALVLGLNAIFWWVIIGKRKKKEEKASKMN